MAAAPQFTVTPRAFDRIGDLLRDEPEAIGLRIAVSGGGCSGFKYEFDLARQRQTDDVVVERNGVAVLVDAMSLAYMGGSEVDFVDDLIGAKFEIRNPMAQAGCGCGTSFAV